MNVWTKILSLFQDLIVAQVQLTSIMLNLNVLGCPVHHMMQRRSSPVWCALIDNLSAVVMTVFSLRAMIWTLQTVAVFL